MQTLARVPPCSWRIHNGSEELDARLGRSAAHAVAMPMSPNRHAIRIPVRCFPGRARWHRSRPPAGSGPRSSDPVRSSGTDRGRNVFERTGLPVEIREHRLPGAERTFGCDSAHRGLQRVCLEQPTDGVLKALGFLPGMCPAAPAVQTPLRCRGNQIRVRKRKLADLFWEGEFCNSAANPKKPSQVDARCCRRRSRRRCPIRRSRPRPFRSQ